jgi:lauroyl/myristoyl acyltransferase
MTLDAPIDARGTEAAALTRALAERLDAMAQATPDQWYVFQPEWKPGAGLR